MRVNQQRLLEHGFELAHEQVTAMMLRRRVSQPNEKGQTYYSAEDKLRKLSERFAFYWTPTTILKVVLPEHDTPFLTRQARAVLDYKASHCTRDFTIGEWFEEASGPESWSRRRAYQMECEEQGTSTPCQILIETDLSRGSFHPTYADVNARAEANGRLVHFCYPNRRAIWRLARSLVLPLADDFVAKDDLEGTDVTVQLAKRKFRCRHCARFVYPKDSYVELPNFVGAANGQTVKPCLRCAPAFVNAWEAHVRGILSRQAGRIRATIST
jgi:hypothetical protein